MSRLNQTNQNSRWSWDHGSSIGEFIRNNYGFRLMGEPLLGQDWLIAKFDTGLSLELRPAEGGSLHLNWLLCDGRCSADQQHRCSGAIETQDSHVLPCHGDKLTEPGLITWSDLQSLLRAIFGAPRPMQA